MSSSTQRQELKAAAVLYRQGRLEEAEARYAQILAGEEGSPDALSRLGELALHRNRPLEAVRLLQRGAERAPRLTRLWPFSCQRATTEAMAYYRADQFPEAARCFSKAAGPIPVGPFRELKALGQHLSCFRDDRPYIIEGPRDSRAPFVAVDPLPVLEVSLPGRKPALFFIDTGAAEVILDRQLAKDLDVKVVGQMRGESAGPSGTIGLGRLEYLAIGELVVRNVPVHILDMTHFAEVFGELEVQGVIGTRFLMHVLATIDYVAGALVLRRTDDAGAPPSLLPDGSAHRIIPFRLIHTHYMIVSGSVNGIGPLQLLVDTGLAGKGFTAAGDTLRRAGVVIDWARARRGVTGFGKVRSVDFVLDELSVGTGTNRFVQQCVPAVAMDPPLAVLGDRLGFHIAGCVSHQFFRRCIMTLDFAGMRLLLEPQERPD